MTEQSLIDHPDRIKWNEKYGQGEPRFTPHALVAAIKAQALPEGAILELACGTGGNALALAELGREIIAVDISDTGLDLLTREAARRGIGDRIKTLNVDLTKWQPQEKSFALALATLYWDSKVFERACRAVKPGGLLAWETFSRAYLKYRPAFQWCLDDDEPAALLPDDFTILDLRDFDQDQRATRRLIARRHSE